MGQEWNHGSIPGMGERFSIPGLRPTQFPLQKVPRAFPWVLKQLGHDVGHSAQSTIKIRMSGAIHDFSFMICTDIFTFTQGIGKIICMYSTLEYPLLQKPCCNINQCISSIEVNGTVLMLVYQAETGRDNKRRLS
jgi:hypothetical protein